MANQEIAQPASEAPIPEEHRWDILVDASGFSPAAADIITTGSDPDRVPYRKHGLAQPRHYSRRGGRSYPEKSESEMDEEWNTERTPLTAEEQARNHAAISAIKAQLQLREDQKFIDKLHAEARAAELRGEDTHPGALWRAHHEKRHRAR